LTGVNAAANRRRNIGGEDSAPHSVGSHEVMATREMKSVYAGAAIGLTIGVGPAIIAQSSAADRDARSTGRRHPRIDHRHASGFPT